MVRQSGDEKGRLPLLCPGVCIARRMEYSELSNKLYDATRSQRARRFLAMRSGIGLARGEVV